jgi:hypothetical protein
MRLARLTPASCGSNFSPTGVRLGVIVVDREGRSRERFSLWLE